MVDKQVMEDVNTPVNSKNHLAETLGVLGGVALALPAGYLLARGGLGAVKNASAAFNKMREPGGFLAPKQPSTGSLANVEYGPENIQNFEGLTENQIHDFKTFSELNTIARRGII